MASQLKIDPAMICKSFGNKTCPTMGLNSIGISTPTYTFIYIKLLIDALKLTINEPSMTQISDTMTMHWKSSSPQGSRILSRRVNFFQDQINSSGAPQSRPHKFI